MYPLYHANDGPVISILTHKKYYFVLFRNHQKWVLKICVFLKYHKYFPKRYGPVTIATKTVFMVYFIRAFNT